MITIVNTEPKHIHSLLRGIRKEDEQECLRIGLPAHKLLWHSYKSSLIHKTTLVDGQAAAVWGVGGTWLGTGKPWLLTSKIVDKYPIQLALAYRREVEKMAEMFSSLENYCDAQYTKSLRLLRMVGFQVDDPVPWGVNGELFCRFSMEAKNA